MATLERVRLRLAAALMPRNWWLVRVEREDRGLGRYTDHVVETWGARR